MFCGWFFPSEKVTPPLFCAIGPCVFGFLIVGHVGSCWMCSWQVEFQLLLFIFFEFAAVGNENWPSPAFLTLGVQNSCLSCLWKGGVYRAGPSFLWTSSPRSTNENWPDLMMMMMAGPPLFEAQLPGLIYPALSLSLSVHTRGATGWVENREKSFIFGWAAAAAAGAPSIYYLNWVVGGMEGFSLLFARRSECNPLRFPKSLAAGSLSFSLLLLLSSMRKWREWGLEYV